MKIDSVTLIYFSPTRTTQKVLGAIARGVGVSKVEKINLTRPQARQADLLPVESDLLVIGMPVYEERVPGFLWPLLESLQGRGQPALAVAVFGNVGYGIVLQQLSDLLQRKGFLPFGGGAFVGEHSFTHAELPVAPKRPERNDLQAAEEFGRRAAEKLAEFESAVQVPAARLPGHLPLQARILPENSARWFVEVPQISNGSCTGCGACVKACPVEAIDAVNFFVDETKCVRCFACVRSCYAGSREIKLKIPWLVKMNLHSAVVNKRENEVFW